MLSSRLLNSALAQITSSFDMERSSKLRKLEAARRKLPFASVSACSAWINEIKRDPSLLDVPSSRKHFKEARDDVVLKEMTAFGPMLQTIKLTKTDDSSMDLFAAHPWALLDRLISKCERLKALMLQQLAIAPCTVENPWHIILYSDEVTPGNTHAPMNMRKFQAVYWSFVELGAAALSHEEYWFIMMTEFSSNVKQCSAGMSQVFVMLCKLFFEEGGNNAAPSAGGVYLESLGIRIFVVMGVILQDGGAHKSVWHSRDGSKMCVLCKNLFTIRSMLRDADGHGLLSCGVTKLKDLVPEKSEDLRNKARYLQYHRGARDFDDLQQTLGVTYHPHMFLLDRYLDDYIDIVAVFMHDFMHAFWVDGIFNLMLYLLFETLVQQGRQIYASFNTFLSSWTWPAKFKTTASDLASIFGPERMRSSRKVKHIKCSAGDSWSLLIPLTVFIKRVLQPLGTCDAECNVFLAMLAVIDLVTSSPRSRVEPETLLVAVEKFLQLFVDVWGFETTTYKFHWLLHLPEYLQHMHDICAAFNTHGWLQHCFVLERKHKVGKRYAESRQNTNRMNSGGLLSEVLCQHISDLEDAPTFRVGLTDGKTPSKNTYTRIVHTLELEGNPAVQVSRRSWHSDISHSDQGDFVVFKCSQSNHLLAGKLQLHFDVAGIACSIIELYQLESRSGDYVVWKPANDLEWIETKYIVDPVVYNTLPEGKIAFVLPIELR